MRLYFVAAATTLLLIFGAGWQSVHATCVFESDFGFTLNCAFKKSGIFRVRNLGGVKGYVGLGFSVGDELGFKEALSQLETSKRRSAEGRSVTNVPEIPEVGKALDATSRSGVGRSRVGVPPFKPLPPKGGNNNQINRQSGPGAIVEVVPAFAALPPSIARIPSASVASVGPVTQNRSPAPQAFQSALQMANRRFQVAVPNMPPSATGSVQVVPGPALSANLVPTSTLAVRTLPSQPKIINGFNIFEPHPLLMGHSIYSLSRASNISVETLAAAIKMRSEQLRTSTTTTTTTTSTTSTTTTEMPVTEKNTVRPKYSLVGQSRVMNAPKEYYPVSYDKNYDDNFTSRVELPETSFSCGDQKHFPGLYADEDLGCMVFHVCAFTDDGLVMKSFLCPESTLFDQTILKCNWWFYVDCKASKKLYDSNIPISKSYQLMKALAFFSSYRNQTSNNT
ncbi:mind the gap [Lycorma delicatula]|uniref:mind the gap n=1 Tax=Lycorma delicatula TaxID=130591 RepID=UPI003F5185D0